MTKFQIWGRGALRDRDMVPKLGRAVKYHWSLRGGRGHRVAVVVTCNSESGNAQLGPNRDEIERKT